MGSYILSLSQENDLGKRQSCAMERKSADPGEMTEPRPRADRGFHACKCCSKLVRDVMRGDSACR